ncbi:FtsB family cell division protein [Maridesulfovibrio bastinii]|uniref:FtsB family cell division protein n=1 Tax=Maridesulfovibrio bastinii TaxID=47157 RepID=UPI000411420D|nr:septum formation initiator family protein [Maridesulfovibrio bastinii]
MLGRRILLGILIVVNLILIIRLAVSDQGIFGYNDLDDRVDTLQEKIEKTDARSLELSREIRRLKTDRSYQEKVIRSRMNYVKDNEILYIFPDSVENNSPGVNSDAK